MSPREERWQEKVNQVLSKISKVKIKVTKVKSGQTFHRCYLQVPVSSKERDIRNYGEFIARELKLNAIPSIHTIFKEGSIVIDIPNEEREKVELEDCLNSKEFQQSVVKGISLPYIIGRDNDGEVVVGNLLNDPHILIAGQSGSGKTFAMRGIINSIQCAWGNIHDLCKFIYIDPKGVEFVPYKNLSNTLCYVNNPEQTICVLENLIIEMENRFQVFEEAIEKEYLDVLTLKTYNELMLKRSKTDFISYIVVCIDELADLILSDPKIEKLLIQLIQKSRAVGIHFICGTQRPSVDIISGPIRANLPTKICGKVAQPVDGRVVFGSSDFNAQQLLGAGDLLYQNTQYPIPIRVQGVYSDWNFVKKMYYTFFHKKNSSNIIEFNKYFPLEQDELPESLTVQGYENISQLTI